MTPLSLIQDPSQNNIQPQEPVAAQVSETLPPDVPESIRPAPQPESHKEYQASHYSPEDDFSQEAEATRTCGEEVLSPQTQALREQINKINDSLEQVMEKTEAFLNKLGMDFPELSKEVKHFNKAASIQRKNCPSVLKEGAVHCYQTTTEALISIWMEDLKVLKEQHVVLQKRRQALGTITLITELLKIHYAALAARPECNTLALFAIKRSRSKFWALQRELVNNLTDFPPAFNTAIQKEKDLDFYLLALLARAPAMQSDQHKKNQGITASFKNLLYRAAQLQPPTSPEFEDHIDLLAFLHNQEAFAAIIREAAKQKSLTIDDAQLSEIKEKITQTLMTIERQFFRKLLKEFVATEKVVRTEGYTQVADEYYKRIEQIRALNRTELSPETAETYRQQRNDFYKACGVRLAQAIGDIATAELLLTKYFAALDKANQSDEYNELVAKKKERVIKAKEAIKNSEDFDQYIAKIRRRLDRLAGRSPKKI